MVDVSSVEDPTVVLELDESVLVFCVVSTVCVVEPVCVVEEVEVFNNKCHGPARGHFYFRETVQRSEDKHYKNLNKNLVNIRNLHDNHP